MLHKTSSDEDATLTPIGNPLATTKQVAKNLGVSVSTLEKWRQKGIGPAYIKLGKNIRYHPKDVNDFKEALRAGIQLEYC